MSRSREVKLTLEQAAGQQFLLSFEGRTHPPEAFLEILKKQHVGGIVLFRHKNMSGREELRSLTRALQTAAAQADQPPLLIAVDQEGGQLMAVGRTTPFPGNMADRKSTRLNSSHLKLSRMPSSA